MLWVWVIGGQSGASRKRGGGEECMLGSCGCGAVAGTRVVGGGGVIAICGCRGMSCVWSGAMC